MQLEELTISRRGKFVVIEHPIYQIEFNLSKGTWNYNNKSGKTIIKNAFSQIQLNDGTTLKTSDPGFREFHTEPLKNDEYGFFQSLRFSYETNKTFERQNINELTGPDESNNNLESEQNSNNSADTSKDNINDDSDGSDGTGLRIHTYLTCYVDHPYILLKVSVENLNSSPICLSNLTLIDISSQQGLVQLGGHPSQYHLFLKFPPISPNSSTYRKIYDGYHLHNDNTLLPCQDGILHDTESRTALIFGFLSADRWWPSVQVGYQVSKRKSPQGITSWALYHDCEDKECKSNEEITSETGYLDFSEDATSSYLRFLARLAADSGNNKSLMSQSSDYVDSHTYSGWSFSYESMKDGLNAEKISEQVDSIANNPLFKSGLAGKIGYIHLDSGWQDHIHVEIDSKRLPDSMKPVVDHIHAKGFNAGISVDPFSIESNSELVQKHPNICLRPNNVQQSSDDKKTKQDVPDDPVEVHLPSRTNPLSILDASHPETKRHVKKLIKKIVDEWGYDFIKADFSSYTSGMMSIASNVTWYDNSLTSTELYRLAVQILTDAIDATENDVLLAGYNMIECVSIGSIPFNYPLIHQKNVENSDKWHHQSGTKHRISRYTGYLGTNKTFRNNVYGNLLIDVPRPVNEAIVEVTAAALSGSAVLCANLPTTLSKPRAEIVSKLFPLTGKAATPIDRYDEPFPKILHLPIETPTESWHLIGTFNWKDQQDDLYLDLDLIGLNPNKDYLVHDFWMCQYLGTVSKKVTLLNIPPRSVKLLCIREQQDVPQLLSTDMHYTQGSVEILSAGWDSYSQSYLLICQPPRQCDGNIFIHVPDNYIPKGLSAFGSDYEYSWDQPIFQVSFKATESLIHVSVQFMQTSGGSQKD